MKFCRTCHAILKVRENREARSIYYVCGQCGQRGNAESNRVHARQLKWDGTSIGRERLAGVRYFEADPSLARVNVPCAECGAEKTILVNAKAEGNHSFVVLVYCKRRGCRTIKTIDEMRGFSLDEEPEEAMQQ